MNLFYEIFEELGFSTIIIIFATIFFAIILCRILFCDDRTTQDSGIEYEESMEHIEFADDRIDESQKSVTRIKSGMSKSYDSIERLENANRRIEESLEESQRIIEEIKKQRIEE